jgi:hypothetical protein
MNKENKSILRIAALLFLLLQLFSKPVTAQLNWPSGQLLPSFPASAQTQDLIMLNGSGVQTSWRWEAEGPSISHKTGRLETDGWLCQTGIDAPNDHMVYGPYDTSVPAGPSTAEFRMKIDNNTANNDPVVDIDVRNATTGVTLASQTVTRQQFSIASNYVSFTLPFTMPADNQAIELRVYWRGASYIKVDYVGVQQDITSAEMYLFASLKGIVNRTQPRIFSYEGDAFAEGPYTWLQSLGLNWVEHSDKWELITKYLNEISGLIVYDPSQIHTVNLATALAKDRKALIASPSLLSKLTSAPYNLPVLLDLRGQFTSKLQVYQTLYDTYWPGIDHRLLIGLSPELHQASLREYATALGAAVIWLDPNVSGESELLNRFLSSMPAGSNFMGWWTDEGAGVGRTSLYGITTIASDYATNLTVHSGMPRTVNVKPMPLKPALQNKIYVAFILSDGDNLQYVEHLMRKLWNNPDRGSVPMGWTLSPAMLDAMPGALNYYHQTSTNNDNLISGPSGYGYTYPNSWPNQNALNQFVSKTEEYNHRAGFRVITVWNTITGGINQNVGETYATYAPTLLGVTAQNTGGALSIYNQSLPGMPLSCNYCGNEQNMMDAIASAAAGWNGAQPRFIIIQTKPWDNATPTSFKNVMNSLNSNYIVVRPDHIFQLIREANGLPIDPGSNPVNGKFEAENYNAMSGVITEACSEGTLNVGAIDAGDWMAYNNITFPSAGTYTVQYRVSSLNGATLSCDLNAGTIQLGNATIPATGNWQTWTTISQTVTIANAGTYNFGIYAQTGGWNINWFSITQGTSKSTQIASQADKNSNVTFDVYPNPMDKLLTIKFGSDLYKKVSIIDMTGKVVISSVIPNQSTEMQLDVSGLNKGAYYISLQGDNCINSKPLLK